MLLLSTILAFLPSIKLGGWCQIRLAVKVRPLARMGLRLLRFDDRPQYL